jgi:hypothetical protein
MPALSSRSMTCAALMPENACTMMSRNASRAALRFEFDEKRSSVASAG